MTAVGFTGVDEQVGDQSAGGGFAVASSDGNGGLGGDQRRQKVGSVPIGNPASLASISSGLFCGIAELITTVGGPDRDGLDRRGGLFREDPYTQLCELTHGGVPAGIRSRTG